MARKSLNDIDSEVKDFADSVLTALYVVLFTVGIFCLIIYAVPTMSQKFFDFIHRSPTSSNNGTVNPSN